LARVHRTDESGGEGEKVFLSDEEEEEKVGVSVITSRRRTRGAASVNQKRERIGGR